MEENPALFRQPLSPMRVRLALALGCAALQPGPSGPTQAPQPVAPAPPTAPPDTGVVPYKIAIIQQCNTGGHICVTRHMRNTS